MAALNRFGRSFSRYHHSLEKLFRSRTLSTARLPCYLQSSSTSGSSSAVHIHRKQPVAMFSTDTKRKTISITFKDRDGDTYTVQGKVGDSLMEVAKEHDIDLEAACEGTLSCSTCHLIVDKDWYSKIPDPLTEEEEDMLDLAFGLTDTSRLGCQVLVSEKLDGIKLTVPSGTSDARNT